MKLIILSLLALGCLSAALKLVFANQENGYVGYREFIALASAVPLPSISSFTFPGLGDATIVGNDISLAVLEGTAVSALAPTYTHDGVSASPASGTTQDFTSPVVYTVTAEDQTTRDYTVTVTALPVIFTETALDVSAGATGLEIQNDGTLTRAYHFGTSGAAATVHGVTFSDGASPQNGGVLDSAMSGWAGGWSGWWSQGTIPSDPDYSRLLTSMVAAPNNAQVTIGGLTAGHTYRLQMISNNPRYGLVTVEGVLHQLSGGNYANPVLLSAEWVATDDTLNVQWDLASGQENPHFNAYVLHDLSGGTVADYDSWALSFGSGFTDTQPGSDPDGDGMTNQQEYAFGLNPTTGSSVNPITAQPNKANGTFSYTRRATPASTGLGYTVLTSTDLVTWTPDAAVGETIAISGAVETVTFSLSPALLEAPKLFVRVQAQ
jgi:hypothetical protein